jgi:hypothetical protein
MLNLGLRLTSFISQAARFARDLWNVITDVWELEERKWEDVL